MFFLHPINHSIRQKAADPWWKINRRLHILDGKSTEGCGSLMENQQRASVFWCSEHLRHWHQQEMVAGLYKVGPWRQRLKKAHNYGSRPWCFQSVNHQSWLIWLDGFGHSVISHDWFDLMFLVLHSIHIRDIWHALWCMWISVSFGGIRKFSIFSLNAVKTWGKTFMIFLHHIMTWLSALQYLEVIWCTARQLPAEWKGDVVFNSPVLLPKPRLVL